MPTKAPKGGKLAARIATVVVAGSVLTLTAKNIGVTALLVGGVFLLIYLGVVLPAVWSAQSSRRDSALTVLKLILKLFRRS